MSQGLTERLRELRVRMKEFIDGEVIPQERVIAEGGDGADKAMRRLMEELNIPPSEPHSGAVWAAAINLMYCSISLNELTPERMRAYGPLAPEAADRLDGIRAELDGLVAKLRTYLGKCAGGDLQQRLQQLGKTGDEIRLLSEIERIITAHGLVEFRGTLSMLLDRMESAAFEVGIFGRVSSGNSVPAPPVSNTSRAVSAAASAPARP